MVMVAPAKAMRAQDTIPPVSFHCPNSMMLVETGERAGMGLD